MRRISDSGLRKSFRKHFLVAPLAAAAILSGCMAVPDGGIRTSSLSGRAGYAGGSVAAVSEKASRKAGRQATLPKAASYGSLGNAPYVCTPSGFGRTSRCHLRRA